MVKKIEGDLLAEDKEENPETEDAKTPNTTYHMKIPCTIPIVLLIAVPAGAAEPLLKVGFGEVDVSPVLQKDRPVYLAGFGHNRKATEIHDPIMARAVVLSDGSKKIAMVSVDVVGLFLPFVEGVRKELPGCAYVLISSTHNHEGPDTLGLWGASPFSSGIDPEYMKRLENGILKAVKNADSSMREVTARIGTIKSPELLNDSREPQVKHDDLVVLEFRDSQKKVVGALVQWNCHPETLGSKNTKVSADYVGYTVNTLRKMIDAPVAYFTGTVGGLMSSLKVPITGPDGKPLEDGTFEKTEAYGKKLAEVAEKTLKNAQACTLTPFEIRTQPLHIPVDNRLYQLGWSAGVLKRPVYVWEDTPYPKNPVEAKDLQKRTAARTEIGYLKLGELEVAVVPGEIYPELVLGKVQDPSDPGADFPDAPVEPSVYGQLKGKHRMLIGLANDEIGYLIPKRQWDAKPPYCYGRKTEQYGEINSLGPETAPIFCKAFAELLMKK